MKIRTFPKFGYNPASGEWNDSLTGDFLWSNVNVSEAVPDVMTPSTWSLWWIFHYETNPIQFPGNFPLCGNICGRPYINLSLLASLYQAIGRDVHKELQGDIIGSAPAVLEIPIIPFSAFQVYRTVLPGAIKAHWRSSQDEKQISQFLEMMPAWCRATHKTIQSCQEAPELLSLWRENIRPVIVRACRMLRSITMSLSEPATKLHLELEALAGQADANTLLSNFSGATADLASLGPVVGLARVANGKMNQEDFLNQYGHRGPHEMELFIAGNEEEKDWLDRQMELFLQAPTDVDGLLADQRAKFENAWKRLQAGHPREAGKIRQKLNLVGRAAQNREAVRSEITRATRLLRSFLLCAGEVTKTGDQIFFLSLDEMADVLGGQRSSLAYAPARREAHEKFSALPPYPALISGRFDPFQWAANPNRRSDFYDVHLTSISRAPSIIKGTAGAGGIVEGVVRRIDCMEEGKQILPGEILVTITTNVGWTPLFPRLAAIVTDVGAPLSHAAIVAREMGIPAVVGCGNASMLLKTGDRVRVDGGTGTIEILEHSKEKP